MFSSTMYRPGVSSFAGSPISSRRFGSYITGGATERPIAAKGSLSQSTSCGVDEAPAPAGG
jgi:hypothetical protein